MAKIEHKEQDISFKTAKLAKIQGFNWFYNAEYYDAQGRGWLGFSSNMADYEDKVVKCPQGMLQRWLRDVHKLHVIPYMHTEEDGTIKGYTFSILTPNSNNKSGWEELIPEAKLYIRYFNYEDTLERGLYEALKMII